LLSNSAVTGGSTPPTGFDRTNCKHHMRKRAGVSERRARRFTQTAKLIERCGDGVKAVSRRSWLSFHRAQVPPALVCSRLIRLETLEAGCFHSPECSGLTSRSDSRPQRDVELRSKRLKGTCE